MPEVAVDVWYKVGARDEVAGRTGFAHLFEHVMFQGTKHIAEDKHFEYLQKAGASSVNGSTSPDRTNYYEVVPANQLELALWLESDRMGFLLDRVGFKETIDNQRDVVKNERRQRYENRPMGLVSKVLLEALYPPDHPYHHQVIGSMEDLTAASVDDVKAFFRTYYVPGNATLTIAGDFDRAKVKELVAQYFGPIPAGGAIQRRAAPDARLAASKRIAMEAKVQQPQLYVAYPSPANFAPGDRELDVLANVLGNGKSSRLFKRLVYDLKIAQSVSASQQSQLLTSSFEITRRADARPHAGRAARGDRRGDRRAAGQTRRRGGAGAREEPDRGRHRAQPGEPAGARRAAAGLQLCGGRRRLPDRRPAPLPRGRRRGGAARGAAVPEKGRPRDHHRRSQPRRADHGTGEEVKRLRDPDVAGDRRRLRHHPRAGATPARRQARRPQRGAGAPNAPVAASVPGRETPDAPFRQLAPPPGPEPTFQPPKWKRFKLKNGLEVFLVEFHDLPLVDLNLMIKTGGAANPPDRAGLADMTAHMLDEGTKSRSALAIADQVAALGATLSTGSTWDASNVSLSTLSRNLDAALAVFSDVIINPAFDAKEFARVRDNLLTAITRRKDSPPTVANLAMTRLLYGQKHPYGWPMTGAEASIKKITPEDLRGFYDKYYRPNNAALLVAGDTTVAALKGKLEEAFAQVEAQALRRIEASGSRRRRRRDQGVPDRQGGRAAVFDPRRHDWHRTHQPRLLPRDGHEPHPGGRLLPAGSEPA